MVVIVGTGRVAGSLATLLAAAGVGHVHLDPHRAVRASDVAPAGLSMDQVIGLGAGQDVVRSAALRDAPTADGSRSTTRPGGSGRPAIRGRPSHAAPTATSWRR